MQGRVVPGISKSITDSPGRDRKPGAIETIASFKE